MGGSDQLSEDLRGLAEQSPQPLQPQEPWLDFKVRP
jgi:hypothetical protein